MRQSTRCAFWFGCLLLIAACQGTAPNTDALLGANGKALSTHAPRSPRPDLPSSLRFKAADCDGDGGLNQVEAGAFVFAYPGLSDGYFEAMSGLAFGEADTNQDYKLSEGELNSHLQAKATGGWDYFPVDCKGTILISK